MRPTDIIINNLITKTTLFYLEQGIDYEEAEQEAKKTVFSVVEDFLEGGEERDQ